MQNMIVCMAQKLFLDNNPFLASRCSGIRNNPYAPSLRLHARSARPAASLSWPCIGQVTTAAWRSSAPPCIRREGPW